MKPDYKLVAKAKYIHTTADLASELWHEVYKRYYPAKQLDTPPKKFVAFLLEKKYVYRDKKGKLLPYEQKNNGLFEVKECFNEKTQWSGTQTLVTPKGRETFRLLFAGVN